MTFESLPVDMRDRLLGLVCAGRSLHGAAVEVGVSVSTAWRWWAQCGRMELEVAHGRHGGLLAPTPHPVPGAGACRRALTSEDRAVIGVGRRQGLSCAAIGVLIGRDRSVVWREVHRNAGADGQYRGSVADRVAAHHRRRPKPFKLVQDRSLCARIEAWMDQGWSPRLIARVLGQEHPHAIMERVSHETIYQALYVQGRGHLRQDLHRQLSTKRPRRRPRTGPNGTTRANSPYREAFTISQRPAEVADRAVPGHWEGDLVIGTGGTSAVGTLVERSTRFTILLHLPGRHDADSVAAAMIREMSDLPEQLRRSLTWDRGTELARYDKIQLDLAMPVYFCDPHSPWQRGTNENTNRLLRHWLTKGTDLSRFTAADLRRIAASLNARPRPTLNMQTPAQALDQLLTTPAAA